MSTTKDSTPDPSSELSDEQPSLDALVFELDPGEDNWTVVGPAPESAEHVSSNPLNDTAFLNLLNLLRKRASDVVVEDLPEDKSKAAMLRQLGRHVGERLNAVLFSDEARQAVVQRLEDTDRGRARLTLRVVGESVRDDRALALPWELLMVEEGTFAVEEGQLDIVREAVVDAAPVLPEPTGPVRVTFSDRSDVKSFVNGVVEHDASVVHFTGHTFSDELIFAAPDDSSENIKIEDLTRLLLAESSASDFSLPSVFFLASRHGATSDVPEWLEESLAAMAREERDLATALGQGPTTAAVLHRQGFISVVGYFGPVDGKTDARVRETFYNALSRGDTLMEAVREARSSLSAPFEDRGEKLRHPLAWVQLAVYLRGPDGALALPGDEPDDDVEELAAFYQDIVDQIRNAAVTILATENDPEALLGQLDEIIATSKNVYLVSYLEAVAVLLRGEELEDVPALYQKQLAAIQEVAAMSSEERRQFVAQTQTQLVAVQIRDGVVQSIRDGEDLTQPREWLQQNAEAADENGDVLMAAYFRAVLAVLNGEEPEEVPPVFAENVEAVRAAVETLPLGL